MLEQNKLVTGRKGSLWFYTEPEKTEKNHLANDTGQNDSFPGSGISSKKHTLNLY